MITISFYYVTKFGNFCSPPQLKVLFKYFQELEFCQNTFFQIKKKNIFLTWIILKREKIQGPTRSVPVPVIFVRCFLLSEKVTAAESETYFYLE